MGLVLVALTLAVVIWLYFRNNPMNHGSAFMFRRFVNWFPLGMTYAFLYMGRYNVNVAKNAMDAFISKESFGLIFGAGTVTYGLSFLLNGPLVDKLGGRKGILIAAIGSAIANTMMGVVTYELLHQRWAYNVTLTYAILYSLNMFFQSYGAVSIIKVKAYWFHVRERGIFGAIFGTLISFGVYFAFDWGQAIARSSKAQLAEASFGQQIFRSIFAVDQTGLDALWLLFFVPAGILVFWFIVDYLLIRDMPSHAGHEDFDTHDASSDHMHIEFSMWDMVKRVLTHPVIILISLVEFTNGVIRNGVMQWYFIFAKEIKQTGAEFFMNHWGLLLCIAGITGGFTAGHISDKYFHSRRGPPVAMSGMMVLMLLTVMVATLYSSPIVVGSAAVMICFFTIAIHSLMSGTAAADFGGRKMTATAAGITDGFVYLGSGLQSVSLGFLTTQSWTLWPAFLIPFSILGIYFALRMWRALPEATRRYLTTVEKITISVEGSSNGRIPERYRLFAKSIRRITRMREDKN